VEIGNKAFRRFEAIGFLTIPVMAVVTLAGFVVVTHKTLPGAAAEQTVFQPMGTFRSCARQRPDHHLDDKVALLILVAKDLARLH